MTMIDPYPADLIEGLETPALAPLTPNGYLVGLSRIALALERIATALEQGVLERIPTGTTAPRPLAALPPVQVVAAKPPCPHHGLDKVASSSQFVGFYCQAKASPGQPANPKGYCAWSVRTG